MRGSHVDPARRPRCDPRAARRPAALRVHRGGNGALPDDVDAAADAGAAYLLSPVVDSATLQAAQRRGLPFVAGASTPTEIWAAWRAGASAVKVFPAHELGGPSYLRAVRGPLPGIVLLPTGGIEVTEVADYLNAGAVAVGIGGAADRRRPRGREPGRARRAHRHPALLARCRPMTTDPELVSIGETMACLSRAAPRPLRFADSLALSIGGAESNTATAAARLGVSAAWMGRLGDDEFGELVVSRLRAEGVEVRARRDPRRPTGLMVKSHRTTMRTHVDYYRRGNAGASLSPEDLDLDLVRNARVLHLSAITPALGESARRACRVAIEAARDAGTAVSVDLNYRAALWSRDEAAEELRWLVRNADVVFATSDEVRLLSPGVDRERSGEALLEQGARRAVVKHGADGAESLAEDGAFRVSAFDMDVVDEVGAGDAFAAGYLAAWLAGEGEAERLRWATGLGAFAVSTLGDWEGSPTRRELTEFLDQGGRWGYVVR